MEDGLHRAGHRKNKPRLALSSAQIRAVDASPGPEKFKLLSLISWAFLLRVASEGLPLRRGRAGDDLTDPAASQHDRAIIGLIRGSLIIRLNRRKAHPSGDIIVRKCTCRASARQAEALHLPPEWCPVHIIWPRVRAVAPPGGSLFHDMTPYSTRCTLRE